MTGQISRPYLINKTKKHFIIPKTRVLNSPTLELKYTTVCFIMKRNSKTKMVKVIFKETRKFSKRSDKRFYC